MPVIAALGLVAYPTHGISTSIQTAIRSKTRQYIDQAGLREGHYLMGLETIKAKHSSVIRAFEALNCGDESNVNYSAPGRPFT
jgi:hypothetical protein